MDKLEYLRAWQKAKILNEEINRVLILCENSAFKIKTKRAAVALIDNITEAFERKNNNDIAYYLNVAKNYCAAIYSKLIMSKELTILTAEIEILIKMTRKLLLSILELIQTVKVETNESVLVNQ